MMLEVRVRALAPFNSQKTLFKTSEAVLVFHNAYSVHVNLLCFRKVDVVIGIWIRPQFHLCHMSSEVGMTCAKNNTQSLSP